MLDQLVESKSNSKENKRRSEFIAVTFVIIALSSLLTVWTYSLFAKDYGMGGDDLVADDAGCTGAGTGRRTATEAGEAA